MSRLHALLRDIRHYVAPPLLAIILVLALWAVAVEVSGIPAYFLPSPMRVWHAFGEVRRGVGDDVVTTLTEAVLGLVLGAAVGAATAITLWSSGVLRRASLPLLVVSQTVPMVVLAPLLTLWFGIGLMPKVVVVALTTFFPVVLAMLQSLLAMNRDHIDLVRTMGARRRQLVRFVLVPSALPGFFAGVRIAASYAVAAAVIGEWVGATSGLGLLLTRAQRSFRIDRVFVAVVIIAVCSVALYLIVEALSRRFMPWQQTSPFVRSAVTRQSAGEKVHS